MPEGVVQSLDPEHGRAIVVRDGRAFPAKLADLEPAARHPGAWVHFDIERDGGVDRAVDISLRHGTRVSPRHRRFGTTVGSRRAGSKGSGPLAHPRYELGLSRSLHPLEVAAGWSRRIETGDVDGAMAFYAPDAVLATPEGELTGRGRIESWLQQADLSRGGRSAEVRGQADSVLVRWPGDTAAGACWEVRCRINSGLIAEQSVAQVAGGTASVEVPTAGGSIPMAVVARGGVEADDVRYAVDKISAALHRVSAPLLFLRLKLDSVADPARERPAIAQVSVDVDGDPVRAAVAGHHIREAADLLAGRLAGRLDHRAQRIEQLRHRGPGGGPGEWRHGDLPSGRPRYFDRPAEERQLVRHKTVAAVDSTPDEALFDMEMADYDFYLFRDLLSGADCLIEAQPDGSYLLTRMQNDAAGGDRAVAGEPTVPGLVVSRQSPPQLTVDQAVERLETAGEDRVFFANPDSGRGSVVYRRYDGHYGLITSE